MGRNPFPIIVPCHRVLAANGRLGGFSATGGGAFKRALLAAEASQSELFGLLTPKIIFLKPIEAELAK